MFQILVALRCNIFIYISFPFLSLWIFLTLAQTSGACLHIPICSSTHWRALPLSHGRRQAIGVVVLYLHLNLWLQGLSTDVRGRILNSYNFQLDSIFRKSIEHSCRTEPIMFIFNSRWRHYYLMPFQANGFGRSNLLL